MGDYYTRDKKTGYNRKLESTSTGAATSRLTSQISHIRHAASARLASPLHAAAEAYYDRARSLALEFVGYNLHAGTRFGCNTCVCPWFCPSAKIHVVRFSTAAPLSPLYIFDTERSKVKVQCQGRAIAEIVFGSN